MNTVLTIASAILEIIFLGLKTKRLFDEAKEKGWIKDGITLNQAINKATTDEERASLSRKLFEHRAN